jgi:hypothetical protein
MATSKAPSWSDVRDKLPDFDRPGLIGFLQDLYTASKENHAFQHSRFGLGDDALMPYKATIDRWSWPDVFKNQDISVAKAKKAIADYEGSFNALVRMFAQALTFIGTLPEDRRPGLLGRVDAARRLGHDLGHGVGDDMDDLLVKHGFHGRQ